MKLAVTSSGSRGLSCLAKGFLSVKNESLYENLGSFSVVFRVEFSFCLFEYHFKVFLMIRTDLKVQCALK